MVVLISSSNSRGNNPATILANSMGRSVRDAERFPPVLGPFFHQVGKKGV
jgi:hypothetical protein